MAHQAGIELPGAGTETSRPPPAPNPGTRLSFRLKVTLVWLAIFAVMGVFFALAKFDWGWMRDNLRFIATGLWVTVVTAVCAIALAVVLALLGALGRLSKNPVAYGVSGFYTSFFRGTPLIVQLFLWYLALPEVVGNLHTSGFLPESLYRVSLLSPVLAGIFGLGFNYGAYMTEIFRAGILAVGPGQTEAADALGMTYRQRMRRVVLPQAFKVVIPPTGNEFIAMMKDTALVSFLGAPVLYWDVFKRAQTLGSQAFKPLEALFVAAGLYWGLTAIFSFFQARLETRVSRGYVRGSEPPAPRRRRWIAGGSSGGAGGALMIEVPEAAAGGDARRAGDPESADAGGEP
jgi:polar amino acid transport system permease protein